MPVIIWQSSDKRILRVETEEGYVFQQIIEGKWETVGYGNKPMMEIVKERSEGENPQLS